MKKLSIANYKAESEKWLKRNQEYFDKLVSINKKGHEIWHTKYQGNDDAYLRSKDAEKLEKQVKELKDEYKGYVNAFFDATFYCMLKSEDDINKAVNSENAKKWVKKEIQNIGKLMTDGNHVIGIFEGIACTVDDFYYLLRNKKGKFKWVSCVAEITEYKKPKSYVMVTNDKGYI